jgi:hypothetical protein
MIADVIQPLDREALGRQFASADPFPFLVIDQFLDPAFAREVAASYPTFEGALERGHSFNFVNERKKVQITDPAKFPAPVTKLNEAISSQAFRDELAKVTGIPRLLDDPKLVGGGMHVTGAQGRHDVHVDFNVLEDRRWHRRLNILIYLTPEWRREWAGQVELWDHRVRKCRHSLLPELNRCVIFETSDRSYHGVAAVQCPPDAVRRSFAAYYYTREAPPDWDGKTHDTVFRARPDERLRGYVLMPAEKLHKVVRAGAKRVVGAVRKRLGV